MMDLTLYLGKPWVSGAEGPGAFDCWGLARAFYRTNYGIELSDHLQRNAECVAECLRLGRAEIASPDWFEVTHPRTGDLVALSKNRAMHHVGIYFFQGRSVLHAMPGSGVVFQRIPSLKINGFQTFQFFRHVRLA